MSLVQRNNIWREIIDKEVILVLVMVYMDNLWYIFQGSIRKKIKEINIMKQYMKKITACMLALICIFAAVPRTTTYAKTTPSVHTTGMVMTVGDCITLNTKNVNAKWSTDQRYIKIQTAETGNVKLIALKAGNVVVKAKSSGLTLKFEIKIKKHPLQNKEVNVSITPSFHDENGKTKVEWSQIKGVKGYVVYYKFGNKMNRIKTLKGAKTCETFCPTQKDPGGFDDDCFYVRAYTVKNGVTIYSKYATAEWIDE